MVREPGFIAKYDDLCPRCQRDIVGGTDRVVWNGARVIHLSCASGQDDE